MNYFKWMFSRWHYWILVVILFIINRKTYTANLASIKSYLQVFLIDMFIIGIGYLIIWSISKAFKKK